MEREYFSFEEALAKVGRRIKTLTEGKKEMSEERTPYNTGDSQPEAQHFLVILAREGKAIKGPIYITAVSHIAARLAYEELPAKDSDTIRVWTLREFDRRADPVEFAAGNLRLNQPITRRGMAAIVSEIMASNRKLEDRRYTLEEIERAMITVEARLNLFDEPISNDRWREMILDELRKL